MTTIRRPVKATNKRTFARGPTTEAGFDGATVDAEGCVWSAQVYVGKIVRYRPDGSVDRVIEMPVKKVTSVMFGGPDLDILFATSIAKPPLPRFPGDGVLRGCSSPSAISACAAFPNPASPVNSQFREDNL